MLLVLFFQSPISRIADIEVRGNELLSAQAVRQASLLKQGDHFFAVSSALTAKRILTLPIVQSATIEKQFPGLIIFHIREFPRVAYQYNGEGRKEAVLSNGVSVPLAEGEAVIDKPVLTGWTGGDPLKIKLCQALSKIPDKHLSYISQIVPAPSVSYPDKIKMYVRSNFEVYTTVGKLQGKMAILDDLLLQLKEKEITAGVLEMLEVDVHQPFELYYGTGDQSAADKSKTDAVKENSADGSKKSELKKQRPLEKPAGKSDSKNP